MARFPGPGQRLSLSMPTAYVGGIGWPLSGAMRVLWPRWIDCWAGAVWL
jgi:hypothetical protein